MLLGGLWHGANWTFVIWGGLHGIALAAVAFLKETAPSLRVPAILAVTVTFLFASLAWVPFRADNLSTALLVYRDMLGVDGVWQPQVLTDPILYGRIETIARALLESMGFSPIWSGAAVLSLMIGFCLVVAFVLPNSAQFFPSGFLNRAQGNSVATYGPSIVWRPNLAWACAIAIIFVICAVFMARQAPFLYFQF